jgi:hypothetical protein
MSRRKRTPARTRELHIVGWQTTCTITVGGTRSEARNKFLEKWGFNPEPEAENGATGSFFCTPYGRACAIWIPGNPRSPADYADVAHEAVHAAMHILGRCGVVLAALPSDDPNRAPDMNDEPWTYLTGAITEEIITFARGNE